MLYGSLTKMFIAQYFAVGTHSLMRDNCGNKAFTTPYGKRDHKGMPQMLVVTFFGCAILTL